MDHVLSLIMGPPPIFKRNVTSAAFSCLSLCLLAMFEIGCYLEAKALAAGVTNPTTPMGFFGIDASFLLLSAVPIFICSIATSHIQFWNMTALVQYEDHEIPGAPTRKKWIPLSAAKGIPGPIVILKTLDRHSIFVTHAIFCFGCLLMVFGMFAMVRDPNVGISIIKVVVTGAGLISCRMLFDTVVECWFDMYAVDREKREY